jgi:TPR repeat protein
MFMKALLLIIAVLFSANSFAGVDEAYAAYDNGAYKKAIHLFKKSAEQGVSSAQYGLGVMYDNGKGTVQDYKKAFHWHKKAAEQGVSSAQYNLGKMYHVGIGTVQDYKKAIHWYKKAAEQNNADAQNNLGNMYINGEGIVKNYVRAHMWWNIAAANGDTTAQENRGIVEKEMTSADISKAQNMASKCVVSNYKDC